MITGNDVSAKLKKQQEWEGLCLGERDVIPCTRGADQG